MARTLVAMAMVVLLSGCLQLEATFEIAADGSGTHDLRLTMPDATFVEARRAAGVNQTAAADPLALFTRATLEKELGTAGLGLERYDSRQLERARSVDLRATFPSPAALRRDPLCGSLAEWEFAPGPAPHTVEISFYPQGRQAWNDARARADAMQGKAVDPVVADFFARRREQLAGLDIALRLRLPGKVLRLTRNMDQTGDNEVTVHIAADQLRTPEDLVRRLAPRFQVVFDASNCPDFPIDR